MSIVDLTKIKKNSLLTLFKKGDTALKDDCMLLLFEGYNDVLNTVSFKVLATSEVSLYAVGDIIKERENIFVNLAQEQNVVLRQTLPNDFYFKFKHLDPAFKNVIDSFKDSRLEKDVYYVATLPDAYPHPLYRKPIDVLVTIVGVSQYLTENGDYTLKLLLQAHSESKNVWNKHKLGSVFEFDFELDEDFDGHNCIFPMEDPDHLTSYFESHLLSTDILNHFDIDIQSLSDTSSTAFLLGLFSFSLGLSLASKLNKKQILAKKEKALLR